jgi:hypothetical protein
MCKQHVSASSSISEHVDYVCKEKINTTLSKHMFKKETAINRELP